MSCSDQVPLYLGIPLAILCAGAGLAFFTLVIYVIVDQVQRRD